MSLTARVTVGQIGVCRESAAKRNPELTHFNQGEEIKERAKKKQSLLIKRWENHLLVTETITVPPCGMMW